VPLTAGDIASFVRERGEARTAEICDHFMPRAAKRTVQDRIRQAEELKLIEKPSQKLPWRLCNDENP
jgi:hypothetical protein